MIKDFSTDNWHSISTDEVFNKLATSTNGLTPEDIEKRRIEYGENQITLYKKDSIIKRFLRQFNNILIYILLASAAITTALNHHVDTSVILAVIFLNAIFGFIQEGKAEKALSAIRDMLAPTASVIREGEHTIISATELVPGDIVMIKSGDKIPADLRIIESKTLQIQEAALTGESLAVEKSPLAVALDTVLAERRSMAYSSTIVTYGKGIGVVVATGLDTEIGKISTAISKKTTIITPLIKQQNKFGWWLTLVIIILAAITFAVGTIIRNYPIAEAFMAIVGLIVAAIPEGMPALMTIILALGVTRMAKRNAIIRRLPAVETMGAVTTICTDKTGTLTHNELAVQNIITYNNQYTITDDTGITAKLGEDEVRSINTDEHPDLTMALRGAILCNDAELSHEHLSQTSTEPTSIPPLKIYGDPIDNAFLSLGLKTKDNIQTIKQNYPRTDMIPYESQHKFMATLHHSHDNNAFIYIKGAPERILEICTTQRLNGTSEPINTTYWNDQIYKLAVTGQKVLAIAYKNTTGENQTLNFADVEGDFTIVAIFGLIDPPREEAATAVAACQRAGIRVKMITGDHAATAATIAAKIGIDNERGVITGKEIEAMDESTLQDIVNKVDIYARTSPEHKLKLVKALQAQSQIVAMTGDGVNDAPALNQANIGIAMGKKGTEIAKEASEMVLADDNFATIVNAVEEGRSIYKNLQKVILYILPTSFAEAFLVAISILLGLQTPLTPVQILWVNMITAVTLSLALGFEPTDPKVMNHPPRHINEPILSPLLIWRIIFVSILIIICGFGLFNIERHIHANLETMRTAVVNMVVGAEIVYLINCRRIHSSIFNKESFFGSKSTLIAIGIVIIMQMVFTYAPFMQHFFKTQSLGILQWVRIAVLAFGILAFVELEKFLLRSRYHAIRDRHIRTNLSSK